MFITFEGIDNSGKTTVLKGLADVLQNDGYDVVTTREPGGTPLGEQIRQIVLTNKDIDLNTKALMINAVRKHHTETVIVPALEAGKIVLCDRYIDSTYAYQMAQGWEKSFIDGLNALCAITPDITFLLDIPVTVGLGREQDGLDFNPDLIFMQKVVCNYTWLACHYGRIRKIDATLPAKSVLKIIELITKENLRGN
jgi:dTMP kinase